jgi:RNA polymerase sigma factor (sigma-70 family)
VGHRTTVRADGGTTSPRLLERVRAWDDSPAWKVFYEFYDPLLRRWCRRLKIDEETSDELCQRIWVELADRIQTFRYDPSQRFRGWLWRLFQSRAIDLFKKRKHDECLPLDERYLIDALVTNNPGDSDQGEGDRCAHRLTLLCEVEAVQAKVRARTEPETWRAFWMVAIDGYAFKEAADALGKTYVAVYYGHQRVGRLLRREGDRRLAELVRSGAWADDLPLRTAEDGQRGREEGARP